MTGQERNWKKNKGPLNGKNIIEASPDLKNSELKRQVDSQSIEKLKQKTINQDKEPFIMKSKAWRCGPILLRSSLF